MDKYCLILVIKAIIIVSSGAIRIKLPFPNPVTSLLTRRSVSYHEYCSSLIPVDKTSLKVPPFFGVKPPWNNPRSLVWKSSEIAGIVNQLLDETVPCLQPPATFRQVFTAFHKEGCWVFLYGGIVRDILRGHRELANDVDTETSCSLEQARIACRKHYGDNCWGRIVLHVGGSVNTSTYLDMAPWNAEELAEVNGSENGLSLEYTANSLAYEWSHHLLIDLSNSHTGTTDACRMTIGIPVDTANWLKWVTYCSPTGDKAFRFWKLRTKGFKEADKNTLAFVIDHVQNELIPTKRGRELLQYQYCMYVLKGVWLRETRLCKTAAICSIRNKYEQVMEADFGANYWASTLRPLFKDEITCQFEAERKPCQNKATSSSSKLLGNLFLIVTSFLHYLIQWY